MTDPLSIDRRLAAALPAGSLFAVGGRVRDEVRSALDGVQRPAKDLDYVVTGLDFDGLVARLQSVGRADVVGAAFAVVKVTLAVEGGQLTVDVALPRRERSTGPHHRDFAVEFGPEVSLRDDLARRDFRMNMMARALPEGALVDPYGGEADVRAGRIDLLRPEAFDEDPLRMLRACQFAARFGYQITEPTMNAMRAAAEKVASVTPERVRDELTKFLVHAERPSIGLELMREGGLLTYVLPEVAEGVGIPQNQYHAYDVYVHSLVTLDATPPGDLVLRLAALLHDVGKPRTRTESAEGAHFYDHENVGAEMARGLLERLRFSGETVEAVGALVKHHMYAADPDMVPATIRRFVKRVGSELLDRQFALRAADVVGSGLPSRDDKNQRFEARVAAVMAEAPPMRVTDLAVNGQDVIAALIAVGRRPPGWRGGPEVGGYLSALLEWVLDDPARNEREGLLAHLAEVVSRSTFPAEHS